MVRTLEGSVDESTRYLKSRIAVLKKQREEALDFLASSALEIEAMDRIIAQLNGHPIAVPMLLKRDGK